MHYRPAWPQRHTVKIQEEVRKTIASRIAVFAAGLLAFGTSGAFAQSRMTADIPFAFETVTGTLPAGTYEMTRVNRNGVQHALRNKADGKATSIGIPIWDAWKKADDRGPRVEFLCKAGVCSIKAIRTSDGSLVYEEPNRLKSRVEGPLAIVTVLLRASNGD